MKRKYESGTFCRDIGCERHLDLEKLPGSDYIERKKVHCADCHAWRFLQWLGEKGWRIVLTAPEISARDLAARIKGIDPVLVRDLTEDEILSL